MSKKTDTEANQSGDSKKNESPVGFDELLKRMLTTPPKPYVKQEKKKPGK
jgi:hypothetical protein